MDVVFGRHTGPLAQRGLQVVCSISLIIRYRFLTHSDYQGEIDVFEGVNNQATNQYTLHTSKGCTSSQGSIKPTGKVSNKQCATINGDNTGCGFIDPNESSYGAGFNAAGGGVFAHLWDQSGIKIWHFARNEIPQDIQAISDYGAATTGSPNPDSWGTPVAFWSPDTCDMGSHFHDHSLVFDTTLCGDWAGATYSSSGCPGTCEQAVADPSNFKSEYSSFVLHSPEANVIFYRCQMED